VPAHSSLVAVLLLIAAVPAARILLKRPVYRELRARPLLAIALLGAAGLIVTPLVLGGPQRDSWILGGAAGAAMFALLAALRARPGYGRSRGLPPGSLGFAVSLDALAKPDFYADAARRWGPVFKMSQFHRPVVCVVDLPLGLELLESGKKNLAQPRLPFGRLSPGNYIEFMNDAQHTRYRGILRTALSGRVLAECRPGVEAVVYHQLSQMASATGGHGVDPEEFLDRIAFASLVRVIFGIPVEDERVDRLQRLFAELGSPRAFAERRPEERLETFGRLTDIVRELGAETLARKRRGESEARSVLGEILGSDPAHLEDQTLIGNLVLIVHVTRSNVRGLLGWALKEHCDHPQWADALRAAADPTSTAPSSADALATNFVNETLRMHQSEYFYREVVRDIRIGNYRIPKGWLLRVCVRECHDRPEVFPEPERFNPGRFAARHFDRTEYSPFSDGTHSCFGAGLAVMIAKTLVLGLATGFDAHSVCDGPVERAGNRHWSHWRPSLAFRVALSRRTRGDPPSGSPTAILDTGRET
jgi:cytochrome P450